MSKAKVAAAENRSMKRTQGNEAFATGAVREAVVGKPSMELIAPTFLDRLGLWLEKGSRKYAPRNWEQGLPMDRTVGSLLRHINQYRDGDTEEDHLAAAACNIMFLIHHEEMIRRGVLPAELNDLPDYRTKRPD